MPAPVTLPAEPVFTPKLLTLLAEGYDLRGLRADALAGLTVAIVALPLSMAIAIASGATPAQGLVTAVVGGFLVSALGGSRHQIGGPAGAFIVLVAASVAQNGMAGTVLATFLSGFILIAAGLLRLGSYVRLIPYPVTVGFTAGIAVIIFASQISALLGLTLAAEPGALAQKLPALVTALPTLSPAAIAVSGGTILAILALKRLRPHWPAMLIAVALAALLAWALGLDVATVGSRYGGIPAGLPAPALPDLSPALVWQVLPTAASFALLGAIESLLSAVVADGMTGRRHRSNAELVAQGVANIGAALFMGLPVTGTIARTATNVRAGARGPVAGMLHALFLLVLMLVAAPLLALIPLAALAGVLAVVAWTMIERPAIAALLRAGRGEAAVMGVTLALTLFRDLAEAILIGFLMGSVLFIHRMGRLATVSTDGETPRPATGDILVYRVTGPLFFGAAAAIGPVLDRISAGPQALVLDLSGVPVLDATGAQVIEGLARKAARQGSTLYIVAAPPAVAQALAAQVPHLATLPTVDAALADWQARRPA